MRRECSFYRLNVSWLPVIAGHAVGVLLYGCATPISGDAVRVPDVKVGDAWTYNAVEENFVDPKSRRVEYSFSRIVERVTGKEIEVSDKREVFAGPELKRRYDRTWNLLQAPGPNGRSVIYSPRKLNLVFPLTTGRSWSENYTERMQGEREWNDHQTTGKVLGSEEITVPAGTFSTLEVELLTPGSFGPRKRTIFVEPKNWGGLQEIFWYAPRIKNFVKYISKVYVSQKLATQETLELIDYRVDGEAFAR